MLPPGQPAGQWHERVTARNFPPPWQAVELEDAFQIVDANGFPVAYIYFADATHQRTGSDRMSRAEARRMAVRIAALPELRQALRDPGE
ncbi:hypothetical protein [Methylobacterium sp. P5_C11]